MNRRQLILGAAGLAGGAAVAGWPRTPLAQIADAPFPTHAGGRLTPQPLADYDQARMSGGPGRDGIPAIDEPQFWGPDEADNYLDPEDVVFGLVAGDVARAYPQRILVWHEIVNDVVGGVGVAVTYCPLTGTTIAFERGATEFGVTGQLVNSNLIMYDRDTDTWFPQMLAVSIAGPHMGAALVERPIVWTTWNRWRRAHPGTEVLSTDTGFARNYYSDPYGGYNPLTGYYAPNSGTMFPLMNEDTRFPPKSVFVGARTDRAAVAFPLDELRAAGTLDLDANGETYTATYDEVFDTGRIIGPMGSSLGAFQAMWFAWAAFYPETGVHE